MDNNPKVTPKDFFLQLGVIVALYAVVVALLNLLFRVINVAFPQISSGYFGLENGSSISFPVATLIIVFPLLALLANLLERSFRRQPEKKQMWIRRWLLMLTLFVAGIVLAGDLITLLYYLLDGRELTVAFLLKVLAVLVVTAGVFGYLLQDFRERLTRSSRRVWTIAAAVIILAAIILGFSIIGSPQTQRLRRLDGQKIMDLQNIQSQVLNHWQMKGRLPANLAGLNDSLNNWPIPKDPQTNQAYEYKDLGGLSFELCANFNRASLDTTSGKSVARPYAYGDPASENWTHPAGRYCFSRVIDPELYPRTTKSAVPLILD